MRFISTSEVGTNSLSQLFSGEQSIAFDHIALGMDPFGFNGIKKGGFLWAETKAEYARLCLRL